MGTPARVAGLTILIAAIVSGCGSQQKQSSVATLPAARAVEQQSIAQKPHTENPQQSPTEAVDAADLLAKRTASYSRDLEDLLKKRAANDSAPSEARTNAPKESAIKWEPVDSKRDALADAKSSQPPPAEQKSVVKPAMHVSPAPRDPSPTIKADPDAANSPAAVDPPQKSNGETSTSAADDIDRKLARQIKDYPRDLASQLDYQLLMFLRDKPVPDLNALSSLPSEDRELITAIIDGLTNFRSNVRSDANMLLSKKVRPLLEAADRMRSQAELAIPTLTLCTKVDGFGRYDPIDPARFPAGKESLTIVYCEIENFSSQQESDKNMWRTELTQDAVLYSETGLQVWSDKRAQITDSSRVRRHDFFVRKLLKLPANLNIGRYVLKVSIVDTQANRVAEASLPIQIVAQ
jgi:hypothetical protein